MLDSLFARIFLEEISSKITLIQSHGCFCWERLFIASSVALSDFSPSFKSDDELSDQPAGPLGIKPPVVIALVAATNVSQYSKDDLQRIFKAGLETQASALACSLAPAFIIFKVSQKKPKARSLNIYCGKSHMDCYSNVRTILLPLELQGLPKFFLPRLSSRTDQFLLAAV